KSYVSGRLGLVSARLNDQNRSERVAFLVVGQSSIDGARSESFYSGVGALVWAMPGLGFMGTAFEMAGAVGGMGASRTGASDYLGLRNLLVTSVIPHLAGAFDITLFALGGSVFTFMFLTLVRRQEDEMLSAADAVALALVSKLRDEPSEPMNGKETNG